MMEIRKLRGNASVINSGGSTKTYKQRESGIFFASAGFPSDFDFWTSLSVEKNKLRNSEYCFGSGDKDSYVGKKNINRRKVYCFGYKSGFSADSNIGDFVVRIKQDETFYLEISTENYNKIILNKKAILTSSTVEKIGYNNISLEDGILEACFDLDKKKVTVWNNDIEVSFIIPDNLISDSALIDAVYWGDMYSDLWSELALSDNRIGNICIKPMLTNAIGDSNDFSDDASNSPILGKYIWYAASIQAANINSKQLYKFSVPDLPNNSKIDGIFVHSNIKGDNLSEMTGIIKIGENEFEGESFLPSSEYYSTIRAYLKSNPISGEAFTAEDLASLQGGCKILGVLSK